MTADLPAAAEALTDFPGKWNERLTEITDWHADELANALPDLPAADVRRAAVRLTARLAVECGGSQWYWPKKDAIERALRDLRIWAEFDGTTVGGKGIRALSKKYGVSDNQIWAILRDQRARRRGM